METAAVKIPVDGQAAVSGHLHSPDTDGPGTGTGIAIAHGAGNDMDHPLIVHVANGLAANGFTVLRFNFPYREAGKSRPDPEPVLEAAWSGAMAELRRQTKGRCERFVAAGKSLGARIASQMAAGGKLDGAALVFYGYPLHAPGKKDRLRDAHLYHITAPMLFFAGTRDALCDLAALQSVLTALPAHSPLITIEGGDHSFKVPKGVGTPPEAIYRTLVDGTTAFLTEERPE